MKLRVVRREKCYYVQQQNWFGWCDVTWDTGVGEVFPECFLSYHSAIDFAKAMLEKTHSRKDEVVWESM